MLSRSARCCTRRDRKLMGHPIDRLGAVAVTRGPQRLRFFSDGWGDVSDSRVPRASDNRPRTGRHRLGGAEPGRRNLHQRRQLPESNRAVAGGEPDRHGHQDRAHLRNRPARRAHGGVERARPESSPGTRRTSGSNRNRQPHPREPVLRHTATPDGARPADSDRCRFRAHGNRCGDGGPVAPGHDPGRGAHRRRCRLQHGRQRGRPRQRHRSLPRRNRTARPGPLSGTRLSRGSAPRWHRLGGARRRGIGRPPPPQRFFSKLRC